MIFILKLLRSQNRGKYFFFIFKNKSMENFPQSFHADKVVSTININRKQKLEQDLKILRKKIFDAFQGKTNFHVTISHPLPEDLNDLEKKEFYHTIRAELNDRKFTVKGHLSDTTIDLIIFSNHPHVNEMEKIIKKTLPLSPSLKLKNHDLLNLSTNTTPTLTAATSATSATSAAAGANIETISNVGSGSGSNTSRPLSPLSDKNTPCHELNEVTDEEKLKIETDGVVDHHDPLSLPSFQESATDLPVHELSELDVEFIHQQLSKTTQPSL